ncbi:hypothetical protein VTL71DRAFT_5532 [Oculimacula yallundae]|uniref:Zn(2)-C6 fungal-type domain-containing protein n=1 Tax=Oculimacula yallundae TaxID=86028 RepID=A0ABR4C1E5_9HELO
MQAMRSEAEATAPRRQRRRLQVSCTECRRRKQKCNPRKDGPCTNCLRRYPPVPCFVQDPDEGKTSNSRNAKSRANASVVKQEVEVRRNEHEHALHATGPNRGVPLPLHSVKKPNALSYSPIPLSRILHPIDSLYPCYEAVLPARNGSNEAEAEAETEFVDSELEAKYALQLQPLRRNLKRQQQMNELQDLLEKRTVSPRTVGGILSMLNAFNTSPVQPTARNTELLYYFHDRVAPTFCSIDGESISPIFAIHCLPWMMNSPLMPNVVILMASASQSYAGTTAKSESLLLKSQVLSQVNKFIQEDFYFVGNQALRIVMHLVVLELFWGSSENIWPHMEGIKQMLKLRGGLEAMNDPLNSNVLMITDYELSCIFERDLYLQTTENAISTELSIPDFVPEPARCPVLAFQTSFMECREVLGLSVIISEILDDVTFLTTSITSCFLSPEVEVVKTVKIQSTAAWLHKRISSLPLLPITPTTPLPLIINDTILLAALTYTSAISTLTPLSLSLPRPLLDRLYTNLSLVGVARWKDISGIFLWILLVATPCSKGDHQGKWLRKQMACTGMVIGMDNVHLGTAYLRAFWLVQRWIEKEGRKEGRNIGDRNRDLGS